MTSLRLLEVFVTFTLGWAAFRHLNVHYFDMEATVHVRLYIVVIVK